MNRKQWTTEILVFLLSLLFLYTGASKLLDFYHFKKEIINQAFNSNLNPFIIYGLPPFELFVAAILWIPKLRLYGLWVSAILMVLFSGYVGLVTFGYYNRVPCSCAGVFKQMSWPVHLIFNIAFTFISIFGIYVSNKKSTKRIIRYSMRNESGES